MRFPPEFIDRLRSQVTLSELVGRRVALKRRGREYTGLCPFHHEKSPSFTVNDAKGFYHCFGCGAHGDAIRFLMENEGFGYREAVEKLAGECGMSLPQLTREQVEQVKRLSSMQDIMEGACRWFQQQLLVPEGQAARDYLQERGLTRETVAAFRIGFAPEGREGLKRHLTGKGATEAQLIEVGLLIRPDSGATYDRFRARLMFPITDRQNHVIAFGGRVLPALLPADLPADRKPPKYHNSPETPLFHKGEVLFNHAGARRAVHDEGTVLVTEGYMDVIALAQAGIENAVAPLGTAVTENHLRMLWSMADEPVMCLDGDAAGQRAMLRAAELSLPLLKPGKSLKFLVLPKGEDPDSLVKAQGREAFLNLIPAARSLSEVLWESVAAGAKGAGPERKAAIEHQLMQMSERIQDPTVRQHFRSYFRSRLWERREESAGANTKKRSAATAQEVLKRSSELESWAKTQSEQSLMAEKERVLLRLVVDHPALLHYGEVEEMLARQAFARTDDEQLRQQILLALGDEEAPLLDRLNAQTTLALTTLLAATEPTGCANEAQALVAWRLVVADLSLAEMQAERQELERQLLEEADEERFARLVELQQQIARLRAQVSSLRNVAG